MTYYIIIITLISSNNYEFVLIMTKIQNDVKVMTKSQNYDITKS